MGEWGGGMEELGVSHRQEDKEVRRERAVTGGPLYNKQLFISYLFCTISTHICTILFTSQYSFVLRFL